MDWECVKIYKWTRKELRETAEKLILLNQFVRAPYVYSRNFHYFATN